MDQLLGNVIEMWVDRMDNITQPERRKLSSLALLSLLPSDNRWESFLNSFLCWFCFKLMKSGLNRIADFRAQQGESNDVLGKLFSRLLFIITDIGGEIILYIFLFTAIKCRTAQQLNGHLLYTLGANYMSAEQHKCGYWYTHLIQANADSWVFRLAYGGENILSEIKRLTISLFKT